MISSNALLFVQQMFPYCRELFTRYVATALHSCTSFHLPFFCFFLLQIMTFVRLITQTSPASVVCPCADSDCVLLLLLQRQCETRIKVKLSLPS